MLFRAVPALHPVGASLRLFKIAPGDFVSGRAEALNEGDRAALGFGAFESRWLDQKCGNDPVDDLQDGREQLRMCSEEPTKRDRKREHPLAHRHPGDDVLDQVGGGLRH